MPLKPTVANVLTVYATADADSLREGLGWYDTAHRWCVSSAAGRDHLVARNAGIVAALSPMNAWGNNKRKAALLISKRGRITINADGSNGIGLSRNVDKAIAIYNGAAPLDVLGGDKVRAFYSTILDPKGDCIPVIDRHAFDIAVGMRTNEATRSILSNKGVYESFANVYRAAARQSGIGAAQMQAVCWIAWRKTHGADKFDK